MRPALSNFLLMAMHTLLHILRIVLGRCGACGVSCSKQQAALARLPAKFPINACAPIAKRTLSAGAWGHSRNFVS